MSQSPLSLFRRRCRQFQRLAWFMVGSLGLIVLLQAGLAAAAYSGVVGVTPPRLEPAYVIGMALGMVSPACYLYAVWVIGQAMGAVAGGDLFQPRLSQALCRAGVALGLGGVFSVFVMTNLMRLFGIVRGSYLNLDIAAMTLGMFGGVLFLLGGLMERAGHMQAELDEIL